MLPPCAPYNQALTKQKGCRFVVYYTPPYLKGTLEESAPDGRASRQFPSIRKKSGTVPLSLTYAVD